MAYVPPVPVRERGAALMIALVLMGILSILGIAAMRGATLENRMVSNAIAKDLTFQSADAATDSAVTDTALLNSVICDPLGSEAILTQLNRATGQSTEVRVQHTGNINPTGASTGHFMTYHFEVVGESAFDSTYTSTEIMQGVRIIAPLQEGTGVCQ